MTQRLTVNKVASVLKEEGVNVGTGYVKAQNPKAMWTTTSTPSSLEEN